MSRPPATSRTSRISLYGRTVAHLTLRQAAARLVRRNRWRRRRWFRLLQARNGAEPWAPAGERNEFLPPPQRWLRAALQEGVFNFLNRPRRLGWPPRWDVGDGDLLWCYQLAYMDYAWSLDAGALADLLASFEAGCGDRPLHWAWDPYPTAVRLSNLSGLVLSGRTADFTADLERRLYRHIGFHAEWLRHNLEYDLPGNHLLEDGVALVMAARATAGSLARRWGRVGGRLLRRELTRQIMGDGMHYERSPLYHARILRHVLNLAAASGESAERDFYAAMARRMLGALQCLTHPDGQPALFNDCVMHYEHSFYRLAEFARRLGVEMPPQSTGPWSLPEAGYYGWRGGAELLVMDAGALGPAENPGHAHGDIFSFELSLGGRRVVVDAGVCAYEPGGARDYCRSTPAHNTAAVDGRDQADFWGAFRVAGLPSVRVLRWRGCGDGLVLEAEHDGYARLACAARHRRRFRWYRDGVLLLTDRVQSRKPASVTVRLHVNPLWVPVEVRERKVVFLAPDGSPLTIAAGGTLWLERGWYCPEFGVRRRGYVVAVSAGGSDVRLPLLVGQGADWELDETGGAVRRAELFPF